jgi:hypothetical protein
MAKPGEPYRRGSEMTTIDRLISWLGRMAFGLATIPAFTGGVTIARAQEPTPVKREILALYDGAQEGDDANLTRIHRFAEMPLNHLGFILRFHNTRTKLPDPREIERYRGVLTWFVGPLPDSHAYLAWAAEVSRLNGRYVILGDIGVAANPANVPAINRLLDLAGLRHTGDYVAPTLASRVVQEDRNLIEFECRLGAVLPDYPVLSLAGSATRVGLMLETPKYDGQRQTALVAIGPRGAYAALDYEFCHQRPPLYQGKWLVNPFTFFHEAFGADDFPIPDTTTVSNRRLYFGQLKRDGWTRSSKIEDASGALAGEMVLRELIEPFRGLPTTIDVEDDGVARFGSRAGVVRGLLQRVLDNANVDPSRRQLRTTSSRFDAEYPSISNLAPLASAGPEHVVNAAMSDETAYSSGGAVGENAFFALKETVSNTDVPRRLKPFNLNYHAYAGEYPALLQSVKEQLQAANIAALAPVSANRYAAIVDGFFAARIERVGDATWRVSNRGALQTVRFDAADGREVDLRSSIGVVGQKYDGTTLYVALDETVEPAVVVLSPHPQSHNGLGLIESRWLVRHIVRDACALSFETQGYGEGAFAWSGAAGRYTIKVTRSGKEISRQIAEADGTGRLQFALPLSAIDPVTVLMSCARTDGSAQP